VWRSGQGRGEVVVDKVRGTAKGVDKGVKSRKGD